jgi:hypothetical protein
MTTTSVTIQEFMNRELIQITNNRGQGRVYKSELSPYPLWSVTTVLGMINKPALTGWKVRKTLEYVRDTLNMHGAGSASYISADAKTKMLLEARDIPNAVASVAAEIGTEVHDIIDRYISDGTFDPDSVETEPAWNCLTGFKKFCQEFEPKFLASEFAISSIHHGYAGTVDALAKVGDKHVVIDFKTGSGIYDEAGLQLASYVEALSYPLQEWLDVPLNEPFDTWEEMEAWVVRLDKTKPNTYEIRKVANGPQAFNAFLAALQLFKALGYPGISKTLRKDLRDNHDLIIEDSSIW